MKIFNKDDLWYVYGIFGRKIFFSKTGLAHILGINNTHLLCKKLGKTNDKISRKSPKPVFPAYFRHFRPVFNNRAPSHFGHYHFASFCQKSEKTNEPISRKAGNRHTDGRTDGKRLIDRTSR